MGPRTRGSVLRRLLPPLVVTLVTIVGGFLGVLVALERHDLSREAREHAGLVPAGLEAKLNAQSDALAALLKVICRNEAMREALDRRDVAALLETHRALFEQLREAHRITHFYFHAPDRECLLRVHQPQRRGDRIERFTAREAERTGETAHGIELGPLGTFTLRVVEPVYDGRRRIGYVELGKEIEDALAAIRETSGVELAVAISKDALRSREDWEAGMAMLGREADWNRLRDKVLIYSSLDRLPDRVVHMAAEGRHRRRSGAEELAFDGRYWRVSFMPLEDVSDRRVGDLIVLVDVSEARAAFHRAAAWGTGGSALVAALIIGVSFVVLRCTDGAIRWQHSRLKANEERLNATLHSIGDAVGSTDAQGRVVDMNCVAERLTGWPLAEGRGMPMDRVFRIVNAQTRRPVENPVHRVLAEGRGADLANGTVLVRRDGSERRIADSAAPIHDADGNTIGVVLVFRDVTEEYRVEEQLRRFRLALDSSADQVFVIDRETMRFVDVNDTACRSLQYSREELLKLGPQDIKPHHTRETLADVFGGLIDQGGRDTIETAHRAKDGTQIPVEVFIQAFESSGRSMLIAQARDVTERRRAEEELIRAHNNLKTILTRSPFGVLVIGRDRRIRWANEYACTHAGLDGVETLRGKQCSEYLCRATQNGCPILDRLETVDNSERILRRRDGREIPILKSVVEMELEGESVLLETFVDITERKQAEEALRESEKRFMDVIHASSDAILLIDGDTFVDANAAATRMLGCTDRDQFLMTHPSALSPPVQPDGKSSSEKANEMMALAFRKGYHRFEWTHRRADGADFPVEVSLTPITYQGRTMLHCLWRDLTEEKQAEKRRRAEARRIEALLKLHRADDRRLEEIVAFAVEEAVELTGSTIGYLAVASEEESVLTMKYWSETAHESCRIVDKPIEYAVDETGLWGEAIRQRKPVITNDYAAPNPHKRGPPDGHVPVTRHMNVPVFDGARIVAVAGVGNKQAEYDEHDVRQLQLLMNGWWQISKRRQAERQLEQYAQVLEGQKRAMEQLYEAAETASRARSEFLANVSHEIRTPMTAILGFAELLLGDQSRQRLSPEQREAVETIQRNGNYLLGLINDILDLSKMEAGKLEIERTECSPPQVLSEVVALMRVRARAKNLSLELELDGPIPASIRTDPLRLRQILINLLGNALKFTEVGGVRVVARLREGPEPRLQVEVIDTGIGIGQEQLSRLFQPFAQADSSTTRRFGGSGLGLAISKRLAEMLHGDLTVTSVQGQGSTFRVSVATGPLEGVAMQDRLVAEGAAARNSGENLVELDGRVLLAEDGPDNQRLIAHILKKAGAEVTVADNGRIAFEQALEAQQEGRPFDVVLMDMQMPEMDGYTATRSLRERGYGGPIVALTAHAMTDDRQKCLDAGCDDFVSKPIQRKAFLELIAGFAAKKTRFTSPTADTDSSRRPE